MPLALRRPRHAAALLLATSLAALAAAPAGAACDVDSNPVAFGTVDPTQRTTGNGRILVTCDTPTSFTVALSAPSGTRRMDGPGSATLAYELYQDSGRSTPWGDGGSRPTRSGSAPADERVALTIHGVIPSQTGVTPGEYLDQLQVTLTF